MAGEGRTRRATTPASTAGRGTVPRRAPDAQAPARSLPQQYARTEAVPPPRPEAAPPPPSDAVPDRPSSGFDLLSRMGHELRSPLSAILGFAQILRADEQAPLSPLQTGMAQQIEASGLAMLAMVNDLVELSRMEAGRAAVESEGVDLVRVLREACAHHAPQAAAGGVAIVPSLPDDPVTVRTDRARVRHLVGNLLAHAIRYNRRDGCTTLCLTVTDGHARVTVADTGGGLTADTVQALFEPFARTTLDGSSLQGAGIGLLVARRLAEALGARLALAVTPGIGTETVFELPLAEPRKQPDPSTHEPACAPASASVRGEGTPPR